MEEVKPVKEFLLFGQPYWIGVLVSAAIISGATFGGVFLSFYLGNKRRRHEDRNTFGKLIESVLIESANNLALLDRIKQTARIDRFVAIDIGTSALQTALISHSTYAYAPWSLIMAMTVIYSFLSGFKNILAFQRSDKGFDSKQVEDLKLYADKCRRLIVDVLQPEIGLLRPQFEVQLRRDKRSREVGKKIKEILNS